MRHFMIFLLAALVLGAGVVTAANAQSPSSGCTPPPGTATAVTCFGNTPCPAGYYDPLGLNFRNTAQVGITRWICQQLKPDQGTSTTQSIYPNTGSATTAPTVVAAAPAIVAAAAPTAAPAAAAPASAALPAASVPTTSVLITSKPDVGPYLTDAKGITLYTRNLDSLGGSTCNGPCATIWLPFAPPAGGLTLPTDATGVPGVITRDDGNKQATYNGMPLYYYTGDFAPGDTNGQALSTIWYAATP
jgi:predicted lipoprotein with Yx(FWY)xxD motif